MLACVLLPSLLICCLVYLWLLGKDEPTYDNGVTVAGKQHWGWLNLVTQRCIWTGHLCRERWPCQRGRLWSNPLWQSCKVNRWQYATSNIYCNRPKGYGVVYSSRSNEGEIHSLWFPWSWSEVNAEDVNPTVPIVSQYVYGKKFEFKVCCMSYVLDICMCMFIRYGNVDCGPMITKNTMLFFPSKHNNILNNPKSVPCKWNALLNNSLKTIPMRVRYSTVVSLV